MNVKLISYSQTPDKKSLNDSSSPQNASELIAFCARVSNPSNQFNNETADKLINYLVKWKHWSPLEMVSACVEVETTRDIARQILRHRSFYFQEFSQRYADPTDDFNFIVREARLQDDKNRQNSIEVDDDELNAQWIAKQEQINHEAGLAYKWAISKGIAKEVARSVLPEGNTVSRMYINGSIRSWVHYIDVRTHSSTQKEHRELAREIAYVISDIFPLTETFVHD